MSIANIPIYPFIVIASLVTILGGFALQRFIAFQNASLKFRGAILTELGDIYPNPVNWPEITLNIDPFLKSKFTTLQIAVEEFKRALPRYKRKAFNDAWFRYCGFTGNEDDQGYQCYHHYMPFISTSSINGKQVTVDNSKTYKETFKQNVDSLLKFAKKT